LFLKPKVIMYNNTSNLSSPYSTLASSHGPSDLLGERQTSPSRSRIHQLGQRLGNLHSGLDTDKAIRHESFESKIKQLDERHTKNHLITEEKLKLLKDQINKLQEGMATEIVAREILDDRKNKEIKLVETNIALELNEEKQIRKEMEQRILKKGDEKVYSLRVDVSKDQKSREDSIQRQMKEISDQTGHLQREIEEEKKTREEINEKLVKTIGDEILKLQEMLNVEKKS